MGIYRNQAQRVLDHVKDNCGFDPEMMRILKIDIDQIEASIDKSVQKSGLNGYKCASALIKLFDESWNNIQKSDG